MSKVQMEVNISVRVVRGGFIVDAPVVGEGDQSGYAMTQTEVYTSPRKAVNRVRDLINEFKLVGGEEAVEAAGE